MARRSRRGSEGVTIVEAAFALPIMLTFIFGLVDLGMWTLNANQATNAARDGARLAILDFATADDQTSAMHADIVDAVQSRLESEKVEAVSVSCIDDGGAPISCSTAEVDIDSVRVEVEWAWDLVTPVAAILGYDRGEATGSATMKLVGRPLPGGSTPSSTTSTSTTTTSTTTTTTTTPDTSTSSTSTTTTTTPPNCAAGVPDVPTSVNRKKMSGNSSQQLASAVLVEFTTNGSAACADLRVRLVSASGESVEIGCGCDLEPPDPPNHEWSYDGSDNIWRPGTARAEILNGETVLSSKNFTVY